MKLAFVLFNYFPYGGLERDFLAILQACRRRGAEIKVYTLRWRGARPEGVTVDVCPSRALTAVGRRRRFVEHVRGAVAREGFDAVVGFNRMPGLDYYYAADTCFADKARRRRGPFYRMMPRSRQYLAFERAVFDPGGGTTILLLSRQQRDAYLRHYATPPERLVELPPGIREDRRAGDDAGRLRADWRREFALGEDDKVVLQIGSGFRVKGVERSLRALAALPPALRARTRYFLVGQDKAGPYRRLARRLGIADNVTILPGRDDIPRFLQGADLLLHPAHSESAGMTLVEAVVAGLPVLCTDTCGYAFHVRRAGAGQVCPSPFRQEDLDHALARMLDDDAALARWRERGIDYGRRHDLYHLPEKAAAIICAGGAAEHG